MRKSNRKLNFTENLWASLFSCGRLKISKCSISLAWEAECSKGYTTIFHTIIYVAKNFQGPFFRSQGVNIFIYIQIVVTLQFLPGDWFNDLILKYQKLSMKYKIHSRINREQLILYRTYKRTPTYFLYIHIHIQDFPYWGVGGVPHQSKICSFSPPKVNPPN